ncbi:glutamyl-tRNA reductase [Streptomyces sp. GC420]|uniref:glutamyl-tRNA reductase n=1 Tax=Streptomyces sp. GC420 TaxID=2697568 RepID=UPI0014152991|nr:glutamyl-tRNA reductase [Streptomyces sp. GC420]NBM18577.1 glutamyl-tRNA reductase [Streptomyces sp. GC420]
MSLLVVGLSHRSAPVSVLERAALTAEAQHKLLHDTLAAEPATEAAVLATCNRIELYADVDKFHAGVAELSTLLARHSGVGLEELTPYLYVHYEDRAVHHLFSVACGLDSMVVGEGQILGQIKDTLARAQDLHTAGRLINDLFQQALRVGKRAHSETGIDRAGQSLVTFGLEQLAAGAPVGDWARGRRALVIGAGSMSSLAATTLARLGVTELVIANRTLERAERLAAALGEATDTLTVRAVTMEATDAELTRVDVAISCTGATGLVLTADAVADALAARPAPAAKQPAPSLRAPEGSLVARLAAAAERHGRIPENPAPAVPAAGAETDGGCPVGLDDSGIPAARATDTDAAELHAAWVAAGSAERQPAPQRVVIGSGAQAAPTAAAEPVRLTAANGHARLALLDLAMPRDIDAAVHRVPGVRLVDIESLAEASADAPMAADVEQVRTIVSDEVAAFGAAQRAAHITPTVVALRAMAADVVAGEIARLDGRLPDLDERQRAEVTQTVRRVVDKLLHAPTVRVKQLASEPGGAGYADALRELFDLDPETVAAVSRADTRDPNRGRA